MQQTFEERTKSLVKEAIQSLFSVEIDDEQISLQETKKEFEGDITLVTFPLTKISRKSPEITANEIGNYLQSNADFISSFNVIKGFLNLVVTDNSWKEFFSAHFNDDTFGKSKKKGKQWMVEYSSPNTNKPLHLGHIRNNLIGYSISELLKYNGFDVVKTCVVNDRGVHISKSMLAWMKWGKGETPESSGIKGDHLVGKYYVIFDQQYKKQVEELKSQGMEAEHAKKEAPLMREIQEMLQKWENEDEEIRRIWSMMNSWVYAGFDETYKTLGVDFDSLYYESDTYLMGKKIVEQGLQQGIFIKKEDGSIWVDLSDEGLDQKLLLRADGTSVYITQDLGTAQLRFDDYPNTEKLVYVVGNEQDYHFKVLGLICKKSGKPWADRLYHLSYAMVDLPSGKMKSREGTVVDADDLLKEMEVSAKETTMALGKIENFDDGVANELYRKIGHGALKYFILKVNPQKRMLFNPEESIDFNGHTGPFIQYSYARIRSVIRRAEDGDFLFKKSDARTTDLNEKERELIKIQYKFPQVINTAATTYDPSVLANYIYELAKSFNQFYHDHSILQAGTEELIMFRLQLSSFTANIIKTGMQLLGIAVPEKM
jgi:arginyl-tRNA synthetase